MSRSKDKQTPEGAAESVESASGESEIGEEVAPSTDEGEANRTDASDDVCGEDDLVATLESQIAELNDTLLRKQADFENFRKRMFREREEAAKYANSKLLLDLVDVIDNFERAIKSAQESQDFSAFHQGIELIERQFLNMLESKYGLTRFESAGAEFDPEKHEAIAAEQSDEYQVQTVVEDYLKGYLLHDRVLRHAKVKVAMPGSPEPAPGDTETNETDEERTEI
jgi:molecular chaperone GrpE